MADLNRSLDGRRGGGGGADNTRARGNAARLFMSAG